MGTVGRERRKVKEWLGRPGVGGLNEEVVHGRDDKKQRGQGLQAANGISAGIILIEKPFISQWRSAITVFIYICV